MSAPWMPRTVAPPAPVSPARPPARAARRWRQAAALCALLAGAVLAWLLWRGSAAGAPQDAVDAVDVAVPSAAVLERGAYLVRVGACMGCHTAQGGVVLAGGGEVRTPFGVFYAPNLTPDAETGLGRWSLADFRRAMRRGVAPGGRLLYPAFPYEQYTALRMADVDAVYHYLRSLPPVAQAARPHVLAFPYGSQWALALWRGLYFRPADVAQQEGGDGAGAQEAGRYLVQAVAHCAACHSPRNGLGALGGGQRLEGGLMPTEGWQAPSLLDSREAGVQHWTEQAVVQLLRTGRTDAGATASGPMADAVFWSTRYLTDGDARAVAAYLQRLPDAAAGAGVGGGGGAAAVPQLAAGGGQPYDSGAQANFRHYCADCHGAQGQGGGPGGAFPPLAGNRAVLRSDPGNMLRSILQGGYAPTTAGNPAPHGMPPFMQTLGDAEIAALATYIRQSWGNQGATVATMEVFRARQGRP